MNDLKVLVYEFKYTNNYIYYSALILIFVLIIIGLILSQPEICLLAIFSVFLSRITHKLSGNYIADDEGICFKLFFSKFQVKYKDICDIRTKIKKGGYDKLTQTYIYNCYLLIKTQTKNYKLTMPIYHNPSDLVQNSKTIENIVYSNPFVILENYTVNKINTILENNFNDVKIVSKNQKIMENKL